MYADAALDDHFDVAQAIAHDGRCEGQRHEAERDGGQLQRERRIEAERPRQRVAERERSDAKHGAPRDPAQLAATGERRNLAERPRQHDHAGDRAEEQVDGLGAIENIQRAGERLAVLAAARPRR